MVLDTTVNCMKPFDFFGIRLIDHRHDSGSMEESGSIKSRPMVCCNTTWRRDHTFCSIWTECLKIQKKYNLENFLFSSKEISNLCSKNVDFSPWDIRRVFFCIRRIP